jgi:hypothetical protein
MSADAEGPEAFIEKIPDIDITESIRALFSVDYDSDSAIDRQILGTAFVNLTLLFTARTLPQLFKHVSFDLPGVHMFLRRFQRDVYGVGKFHALVDDMEKEGLISPHGSLKVKSFMNSDVGVRVNTASPKKTKIAAVFTLWMTTIRPVHLERGAMFEQNVRREDIERFTGMLTFFLASSFLSLYGRVVVFDDDHNRERMERIKYDFTYRALNLSSLEMLYACVFTPKASEG